MRDSNIKRVPTATEEEENREDKENLKYHSPLYDVSQGYGQQNKQRFESRDYIVGM